MAGDRAVSHMFRMMAFMPASVCLAGTESAGMEENRVEGEKQLLQS